MNWWETLLTALGSSLVGGGLTARATWSVFRRQERAALAREVRTQLGAFAGSLTVAVAFLMRAPEDPPEWTLRRATPSWVSRRIPESLRRWVAAGDWVRTQRRLRQLLGDRPFRPAEEVVLAAAPLRVLPLPSALREAIDGALDYVTELGEHRTAEVRERWPDVRERLFAAARAAVPDADEVLRALGTPPAPPA